MYYRYNLCRTHLTSNQEYIHCSLAFYGSRCLLITLMKAYDVIVHIKINCTIDITYVEHICESNQEYIHCSLSFYVSRCLLITLMKALRCVCTNYRFTALLM